MPDLIVVNRPLNIGDCFMLDEFIEAHVVFFEIAQSAYLTFFIFLTLKLRIEFLVPGGTHEVINIFFYHFVHDLKLLFLIFLLVSFLPSSRLNFVMGTALIFGNSVRFFNNAVNFIIEKLFFRWTVFDTALVWSCERSAK